MKIASTTASPTFQASPGMMIIRKENVARSMIMTSTNVAVIMRTSCLNCDSAIRMMISDSDSAAAVIGRRSRTSQKKLSRPQVRTKAARAARSASDQINRPAAAS